MKPKTRKDLLRLFIDFFKKKNHKEIPSSSLIPENDPTVLFTTAGMHPLIPYLLGEKHPLGKRLVNVQKCLRTGDIEEIGDELHHTFFEMLGNWSLGDYFKKESIRFSFEFMTKILKMPLNKLAITIFKGDKDAPTDNESAKSWESLGIKKERIAFMPKADNWWGPAGTAGPCGPDTEIYYWKNNKEKSPKSFNPKDKNWVEIWNNVFMEYNKIQRIILIDGMHCLYNENFKINQELLDTINSINSKKILVINGNKEKAKEMLKNYNFEFFSLEEEKIKKENPEFFKRLLEQYNLSPKSAIYLDYKQENINSAKKFGIITELYKNNKQAKRFIEDNSSNYIKAQQKNVDTGMGVERTLAVLNNLEDNYLSSIFQPIIKEIEKISKKEYKKQENKKPIRIIADHIRASVFILGDEKAIKPSNIGQGYILRRLIRRAIRYGKLLGIKENFTSKIAEAVIPIYPDYPELKKNAKFIEEQLNQEEAKFNETLENGMKKFTEMIKQNKKQISGKDSFLLFQSYGFPIEMTIELAKEKNIKVNIEEYKKELEKHQELSRTATAGAFKSGLADSSEKTKRLHTATHLLNESLKIILKNKDIRQKGSNITPERTRFDFNFPRKLTDEEIKKIENWVNEKINQDLEVKREEMPLKKAFESGAGGEFEAKYPSIVSVYTIEDKNDKRGYASKEICTGPHVKNTKEIGKFKIIKEESVSFGVRRIKAIVE